MTRKVAVAASIVLNILLLTYLYYSLPSLLVKFNW